MLSVSSLIEFLLSLLRDDEALAEFEADPDGVLARSGLTGVTAGDVRDVAPLLADRDGVSFCGDDGGSGGGPARVQHDRPDRVEHHAPRHHDDDPVREIHHVTRNYHAEPSVTVNHHNTFNEYTYVDNRVIDDRDIHIEGDGNSVAQDSFNQDNDGVDNKGGEITDSVVGGGNVSDSGNDNDGVDNDGVIVDSLNEDNSQTETVEVVESFNADNSSDTDVDIDVQESFTSGDAGLDIDVTGRNAADDPYNQGSGAGDDLLGATDPSAA